MAILTNQTTGQKTQNAQAIAAHLSEHGLTYEQWDIGKLDQHPIQEGESAQDHILRVFAQEVEQLCTSRGYQTADVIALRPETENLDALLAKFDKEHMHTEDEVRFTVSGRGIFTIRGRDNVLYDVEVHPGDLLVVPEGTRHYFTLCEDKSIQCIRLFTDSAGWVAHYVDQAV